VVRYARKVVRSTHDVRAYLTRRAIPRRLADAVIARCQSLGVLDDRAAARLWADHWSRQGYAWSAIRLKLTQRGFEDRVIQELASSDASVSHETARARAVVAAALHKNPSHPHPRGRTARLLAARGFDADVIDRVLVETFGSPTD
jgi:SOS response regulatory protein OraA/RecX